jgi:AraC-like DNA-binding protein
MTGRTLQRALKMENTSFIDIRDSVRAEMAKHYLENSDMSIEDISIQVGFADASGFYTAFKRWYGVSPGSFRK